MAFSSPSHVPYQWQDAPLTGTPLDSAHLEAAETDLVAYAQQGDQAVVSYFENGSSSKVVTIDTIAVNALDHGLVLDGVTDDGPALNALYTLLSNQLATGQGAVILIPSRKVMALGTTVVRQPRVHLVGPGAKITVLPALNAGPVFTNTTAAPLVRSDLRGFVVDKAGLTGTLFDTHSMQWCKMDELVFLNGTSTCTNFTLYADAITTSDGDAKTNALGNEISFYDRGSCGTNVLCSGLATAAYPGATGPAVITLNSFDDCSARGIFGVSWDLVQWCDDNVWTGMCANEVKANGSIVVRLNNSANPALSAGVYCNEFMFLTAENYGAFAAQGVLLNYSRGTTIRNYFADPGFGSGTGVVDVNSQSHWIERIGVTGSNNMYVYRKGYYAGFDESTNATGAFLALMKSRNGGIINALDYVGRLQWNAQLTGGEVPVAELRTIVTNVGSGTEKAEVRLATITSGALAERFRFSDDGRLGIGVPAFTGLGAGLYVTSPAIGVPVIRGAGFSGQTANLLELWDSTLTTNFFAVSAAGAVTGAGSAALLKNFKRQMRKGTTAAATPSATLGVNGTPVTFTPAAGFYGLEVAQVRVTSGGTFGAETLTWTLTFTFSDSTTQTGTGTFTATGVSSDISNGQITLWAYRDAVALTQVDIRVQSTINSSTANATMTVAGVNT